MLAFLRFGMRVGGAGGAAQPAGLGLVRAGGADRHRHLQRPVLPGAVAGAGHRWVVDHARDVARVHRDARVRGGARAARTAAAGGAGARPGRRSHLPARPGTVDGRAPRPTAGRRDLPGRSLLLGDLHAHGPAADGHGRARSG